MRFGRMDKRYNERTYNNIVQLVERMTGKSVTEKEKNFIAKRCRRN